MKILSRADIEAIGERIVTQYRKLPEVDESQLCRVDPVLLAKRVFGLSVEYEHLSLDRKVLGVTSYQEAPADIWDDDGTHGVYYLDGKTILVEKDLAFDESKTGRRHFTIVHETAHQILAFLFPQEYGNRVYRGKLLNYHLGSAKKQPIKNWEEWQANTLASAILLPEELVKYSMFVFGLPERIKWLNRVYGASDYEKFSNMATFLGVSRKALAIRMRQLGLLEKEYLDNPHAIVEVEYEVKK